MTTMIVPTPTAVLVIKRLTDFTVKRLAGIDNIPHLCVKVRHNDGWAWFGINILSIEDKEPWSQQTTAATTALFMEAMNKIVDLKEMITDVSRLMDSIQDITTGRRRPIMFGGLSNEKMQITAKNNVQIEVYSDAVKEESQSYGGHMFELDLLDRDNKPVTYGAFVYHRGVVMYNYADEEETRKFLIETINQSFPEIPTVLSQDVRYITQIERHRSKPNRH